MTAIPLEHVLIFASILFVIGFIGVIVRKNTLFMLMSLEVMLNSVGVAFIGAGLALFSIAIAAAEVAVGLALLIQMHHRFQSLNIDKLNKMRG